MAAAELRDYMILEPVLELVPRPKLSLIIPAYNEELRLEQSLITITDYLASQSYTYEVIVSDDGSTDKTRARAEAFSAQHQRVRSVSIPHAGKAVAIRAGMESASGEIIAFTDADLATPISYIAPFMSAIQGGADVVIGSREGSQAKRIGEPVYRHVMGRVFNRLVQAAVLPGIHDTQCGFKMFTRFAAREIGRRARLYASEESITGARVTAFDVEMLVIARKVGMKIVEIPVTWTYGEQSKVNPVTDTLTNLRDIGVITRNKVTGRYD